MPNGRLAKTVVKAKKPAEIYHNSSGNAASVTLQANTISTNTNTEISVVVGVAATTLSQISTEVQMSAGAFCSMTSIAKSCDWNCITNVGMSTFAGTYYPPRLNRCSLGCFPMHTSPRGINLMDASHQDFVDKYGCRTQWRAVENRHYWICTCSSTCWPMNYGGNEQQNPAIWMRQGPASCNDHGPFYAGKIIGYFLNDCCACCWTHCSAQFGASGGTWYPISARNVGMGYSSNAAVNATQLATNWCCCCGYIGDTSTTFCGIAGNVPVLAFSGCSQTCCQGGSPANLQWCKRCGCHCCEGAGQKMFNWYMLDRDNYCCCDNFTNDGKQCFKCNVVQAIWPSQCCAPKIAEGKLRGPLWMTFYYCCSCACGRVLGGDIQTCWSKNCEGCACSCWKVWWVGAICSCCNASTLLCQSIHCYCHPCSDYFYNSWDHGGGTKMSPYSAWYGMTNCSFWVWTCYAGGGAEDSGPTWRYFHSFPDCMFFRCCMQSSYECYYFRAYRLNIDGPTSNGWQNEGPIKYWAWNPHPTNIHGSKGCTYVMARSRNPDHCGIFSFDAHCSRVDQGPHCFCNGNDAYCCGTYCPFICHCFGCTDYWTKVSDFPTAMASGNYSDPCNKYMCVSCLFRTDYCNWVMNVYNYFTGTWDGFYSQDLKCWKQVSDPYNQKMSETLTTQVSSDYACIVSDCNCFFSNIDCSGIVDWKISIGQYERTGLVLSADDRIMINNTGDTDMNIQVWGYEG